MVLTPAAARKKVAVVGAGPAGLSASTVAAECGHDVVLFDAAAEIGGQFNIAKKIPGKEEFYETLRYFGNKLELTGVDIQLNKKVSAQDLIDAGFDEVILATGIIPRVPPIEGIDHPKVKGYIDVIAKGEAVGEKVAVIGAGGIGYDVSELLVHEGNSPSLDIKKFNKEWGVDEDYTGRGAWAAPQPDASPRQVTMLQRKSSKMGAGLGKTSGWVHRASLKMKNVEMITGVSYDKIDDQGLHITINDMEQRVIECDNIILCAGQVSRRDLQENLEAAGVPTHLVGGSKLAGELDAKRAIKEGFEVANAL
jgi:2,4-dienoyl-CoA reductase (NADPH2)